MPQLTLEFSNNVLEKDHLNDFFKDCHVLLATLLPTDINSCKSRAIKCKRYYIGQGQLDNAFVHLSLKILPGRNADTKINMGNKVMALLEKHFTKSLNELNLQITLELTELSENYFKIISKASEI